MIHVCPLDCVEDTVETVRASHLVSILNEAELVPTPWSIPPNNHLRVDCHDIVEPLDGCILPTVEHIREVIAFARDWPGEQPLVIHCYAGISRSTATAYIAACLHSPPGRERALAQALRIASPTATPNGLIIALADRIMGRDGRMITAIAEIGRGQEAGKGIPFRLPF